MSWLAAQAPARPGASRLSVGGIGGGGIDAVGASKSAINGIGVGVGGHISGAAAAAAAALSMYDDPPEGDVSIEEFEVAAIDRLRGKRRREEEREREIKRIKGIKMRRS